jgi:hypothetical protein
MRTHRRDRTDPHLYSYYGHGYQILKKDIK